MINCDQLLVQLRSMMHEIHDEAEHEQNLQRRQHLRNTLNHLGDAKTLLALASVNTERTEPHHCKCGKQLG